MRNLICLKREKTSSPFSGTKNVTLGAITHDPSSENTFFVAYSTNGYVEISRMKASLGLSLSSFAFRTAILSFVHHGPFPTKVKTLLTSAI